MLYVRENYKQTKKEEKLNDPLDSTVEPVIVQSASWIETGSHEQRSCNSRGYIIMENSTEKR